MKYQIQKTMASNDLDETTYHVILVGKPVNDVKLAKSKMALEKMKDERLNIPAKYSILKLNAAGDIVGLVNLK